MWDASAGPAIVASTRPALKGIIGPPQAAAENTAHRAIASATSFGQSQKINLGC